MELWKYWKATNELYIKESLFICYLYPILSNDRIDFDLEFGEDELKILIDCEEQQIKVLEHLSQFEGEVIELY